MISSSTKSTYTFSGNWVDLLYQDTNLNEGKERWEDVSGDVSLNVLTTAGSGTSWSGISSTNAEGSNVSGATDSANLSESYSTVDSGRPEEAAASDAHSEESLPTEASSPQTPGFSVVIASISVFLAAISIARKGKVI